MPEAPEEKGSEKLRVDKGRQGGRAERTQAGGFSKPIFEVEGKGFDAEQGQKTLLRRLARRASMRPDEKKKREHGRENL